MVLVRSYSSGTIVGGKGGHRNAKEKGQSRQLDPNDTRQQSMYRGDSFLGNGLLHLSVTHMLC